ncbi:MAG: lytic murein transglycosylase [Coxiellaceae bacterium]|nr:lytic murein transglycosylase [Coxiellaceae bacterium]
MKINRLLLFILCLIFSCSIFAASNTSWKDFVAQLRVEAIAKGIRPAVFDKAFQNVTEPHQGILRFDRTQPEKRLSFIQYRSSRAPQARISLGKREMKKYAALLQSISTRFGVSKCFIVSLWGLETSYGRVTGNYPVIQSLATLAYDNRRAAFFRKELFYALEILNGGHVKLERFKGEWAGATGQSQFLPSSWHAFAVDYDGDGRKDIWDSRADVFASIANYLVKHGWQSHQPWGIVVRLPNDFDSALASLKIVKTVSEWEKLGVHFSDTRINPNLLASIIKPDGGPDFMVFNNFKVLMRWNHSIYYAGTVGYLADQLCDS